ncbi:hypothetical protein [Clostridium oryzae]|uniref:Uncharacterized protein n=1 Tax=Clostridium oryzae TaxID=1450648 RepID=A0A1V4IST3_9CLOT|nr:hypothetical protein [Clostridium oryzae]OPJ62527.1 hypothetical protein CLORY_16570 [Clostridium oryzae]
MKSEMVTLRGIVKANQTDILHYELKSGNEIYVLFGDITDLNESIDCEVEVTGTIRKDEDTAYTRGKPFDVKSIKRLEMSKR